jgi:uncharacterized protein (DUF433 family)
MNENLLDRITMDPDICFGKPTMRGLRYPVEMILDLLSSGMTTADILNDYPDLEEDDIKAALQFAAKLAKVDSLNSVLAA